MPQSAPFVCPMGKSAPACGYARCVPTACALLQMADEQMKKEGKQ